jgi:hypothetical protein
MVQYLTAEREDGTLLRANAIPDGIGGYFIGKLVTVSGTILAYLAIILIPGLLIVDALDVASIGSWLTLAWVLLLGLIASSRIFYPDHRAPGTAAGARPGVPDVLAWSGYALRLAAGYGGQRRARRVLAAPADCRVLGPGPCSA